MKKTIHLYILKEIAPSFAASLIVFTFILLIDKILRLTELVINKGVAPGTVFMLFLYIVPSLLVITVPIALLIAILFAFARFSSDSEIIAMKSCGISLYGLFPPVISFAFVMYALTSILMIYALPHGNTMFKKSIYNVVESRLDVGLKERIFNDDFKDIVIFVNKIDDDTGRLEGIIISDTRDAIESHTIMAKSGELVTDRESMEIIMSLRNGSIHRKSGGDEYHLASFKSYRLKLSAGRIGNQGQAAKGEREMTLAELKQRIRDIDSAGGDSRVERVEFHKKFSLPFACLVFGVIASPLGIFSRRSGKSKGFTLGIFVILAYYILLTFGESAGKRGLLAPSLSMWLPNIVLGAAGIYIFIKSANESPVGLFEFFSGVYESIEDFTRKIFSKYF